ncbi:MAG: type II toxin-antitoxin system Phd/YefM family antitoxin [Candidatus Blackburnbacteria bacterium]|nr:type II toxin-antitoxin system Phd/YefM family antitoxin [Candidatus Blackburnbacteria bacterium]
MLDTVSITELKQNTAGVVKKLKTSGEPIVVIQRSEPAMILMEPEHYEMLEALEDAADLRVIHDRKNEPTTPAKQVAKELGLK